MMKLINIRASKGQEYGKQSILRKRKIPSVDGKPGKKQRGILSKNHENRVTRYVYI